jgi:hypothetical protein
MRRGSNIREQGVIEMGDMYVRLQSDTSGNYSSMFGGGFQRLTNDADRKLFNLSDDDVKKAIGVQLEKEPKSIYYNNPTGWSDYNYDTWGWPQINVALTPVSAVVTGKDVTALMLATNEVENGTDKIVPTNLAFTAKMNNSAEVNWSKTSTLSVSQDIGFEIGFFGSKTTFGFSQAWQNGASHSQSLEIGSTTTILYDLDPKERVVVQLWGEAGKANVEVTYQATLTGVVFCNYKDRQKGHFFWGIDIGSILNTLGRPNSIEMKQQLSLTSYLYTRTVVTKPTSALQAEGGPVVVFANPDMLLMADMVPDKQAPVVGGAQPG